MSTQEFPAAEPVSTSQMSDADEVGARVAREDISREPRVVSERRGTMTALSLVTPLPQSMLDEVVVEAAYRLNDALDGTVIDAPGAVGDALNRLRDACVNARR